MSEDLGKRVSDQAFEIGGAQGWLHERGLTINDLEVRFGFPMIGKPQIATARPAAFEHAVHFDPGDKVELVAFIQDAVRERFCLSPVGQPSVRLPLVGGQAVRVSDGYGISFTGGELQNRQLYDVALRTDGDHWVVVAPHTIYGRKDWTDFGIAHITDMHVAKRIDSFSELLRKRGRNEAADNLYNWNDRFRGFVRYANYLHKEGILDVILTTGDNYDYQFNKGDARDGGGNAEFLRDLMLGKAPGPKFADVEELRVPIFMVPGNHDYRINPYRLFMDVHLNDGLRDAITAVGAALGGSFAAVAHAWLSGKDLARMESSRTYRISDKDAVALANELDGVSGNEVQNVESAVAAEALDYDEFNRPYRQYLNELGKYVIELGPHRVVMLDSAYDVGVVKDETDAVRVKTNSLAELLLDTSWSTEDEDTFVGGSPNSVGVPANALEDVLAALKREEGLVIVGVHAPLLNPVHDGYHYFLRETQRPVQGGQVYGFLASSGGRRKAVIEDVKSEHPTWFDPGGGTDVAYVKRKSTQDSLDIGVSRGSSDELLQLVAGFGGAKRKADLVLAGHTHYYNEYRVAIDPRSRELAYYMDFYTQNPTNYYPAKFTKDYFDLDVSITDLKAEIDVEQATTYIEVAPGAERGANPWKMPFERLHPYMLQIPPYANPLNSAPDAAAWWEHHRPLVLQTGALGPLKVGGEFFSGFRVIMVKNNIIEKIHHISIARLEDNHFKLDFDKAVQPEPGRAHHYVERSRAVGAPKAVGAPSGIAALRATNVVYRDKDGQLHEAWRKGADAGTSNLTQLASNALPAAGDPTSFVDTVENKQVALYRGTDGHVYSLYWSTGAVGRDALSVTANASKAKGSPVGYTGKDGYRHVFYRAENDHVEELFWRGSEPPRPNDISTPYSAPKAAGDPVAYQKPNGENNVFYRGDDKHVHRLKWLNDAVVHEDLSPTAGAPDAAGNLAAYYAKEDDSHHVVYRGTDGHVHELSWQGENAVRHDDLVAGTKDAPPAADGAVGDPVAYYTPVDRTNHVVYFNSGHLYELSWSGTATPICIDLTAHAVAPVAADKPSAFVDRDKTQHVMYRGADNQVHEIWWGEPQRVFDVPDGPIIDAQPTEPTPLEPLDPNLRIPRRGGPMRRDH